MGKIYALKQSLSDIGIVEKGTGKIITRHIGIGKIAKLKIGFGQDVILEPGPFQNTPLHMRAMEPATMQIGLSQVGRS